MEPTALKLDPNNSDQTGATDAAGWNGFDLRPDLAFPTLSDDMVQRLRSYGKEENFSGGMTLYTHGDRLIDMFVVLEGGVDVYLPSQDGQSKVTGRFRKNAFTGELNLLNSQRAVVEDDLNLHGRVAPGVQDLPGMYRFNRRHRRLLAYPIRLPGRKHIIPS